MKDKNLSFRKSLRTYCKTLPCAQWKLCIQEEYSNLQARVNAEYRELCFLSRLCFSLFFSWGQSVVSVYAEYYPLSGDRRWRIACGIRKPVNNCQQSAYYQGKFKFTCPQNSFITGIYSMYSRLQNVRLFSFKCCSNSKYKVRKQCKSSRYRNSWAARKDYYMTGVRTSENDRWSIRNCKLKYVTNWVALGPSKLTWETKIVFLCGCFATLLDVSGDYW